MEKVNYYDADERISWLASRVISDEHFGVSLTEEELDRRLALEEDYKDEIALAKLMLQNNPNFVDLPVKEQINLAANLILELRERKTKNNDKSKK
ncbi:MAG: hypothetical protein IJO33_00095 [Bacilli bacterium]|nr:hypothetical protein [Bacilli bacterium]